MCSLVSPCVSYVAWTFTSVPTATQDLWIWQDSDNSNTIFNFEYALSFELLVIYSWKESRFAQCCCTLSVAATWKLSSASLTKVKEGIAYSGQCLLSKLVIRQINIELKLFLRKDELDYVWTFCLFACLLCLL